MDAYHARAPALQVHAPATQAAPRPLGPSTGTLCTTRDFAAQTQESSEAAGKWEHKRGEMKLGKQRQLLLTLILAAAPSHASPIVRAMSMPLQRLGRLYGSALSKNPVLTHCFQGAAISGIGLAAGSPRGVRERGVVLMCVFCLCR